MAMLVLAMASCGKDYTSFIGTWGVKSIDYYNIDFAGNPIPATIETYYFTPGDTIDGIDLVFRADKTGQMIDRSRDTLKFDWNPEEEIYETVIVCPDTVVYTNFSYSYNASDNLLFMNILVTHPYIYQMKVEFIDDDTFVYENEYDNNYVERATMVRYSKETGSSRSKSSDRGWHPGSLFSN